MTGPDPMYWYLGTNDEFAHYARSGHAKALCGWDLLYSPGLPLRVDESHPRCPRCERVLR